MDNENWCYYSGMPSPSFYIETYSIPIFRNGEPVGKNIEGKIGDPNWHSLIRLGGEKLPKFIEHNVSDNIE